MLQACSRCARARDVSSQPGALLCKHKPLCACLMACKMTCKRHSWKNAAADTLDSCPALAARAYHTAMQTCSQACDPVRKQPRLTCM